MKSNSQRLQLVFMYFWFEHLSVTLKLDMFPSVFNDMLSWLISLAESKIPEFLNKRLANQVKYTRKDRDIIWYRNIL